MSLTTEHFWSPYKSRFKKKLLEDPLVKMTQEQFEAKVREVGDSFTQEECTRLLRSNFAYMRQMLNKYRE